VQLGPYIKNKNIWYCPSDKFRRPTQEFLGKGQQSYQWFPNWVFLPQYSQTRLTGTSRMTGPWIETGE
jgi:hypothetical protein